MERIPFGRVIPEDKESLLHFIEEPLRDAIGMMFDKNIPTIGSSCNARDYAEKQAWITVDYDFMEEPNQRVADEYANTEKFRIFYPKLGRESMVAGLVFPIGRLDLPSDIGKRALVLAEQFQPQSKMLSPV